MKMSAKKAPLNELQKELIRLIARQAAREFLGEEEANRRLIQRR
jgi:hypothetical protein